MIVTPEDTNAAYVGFLTFWTFVIILQIIIPLSLYVTIEMAKLLQIYLIHQDADMFDALCGKRVECRALNIPEELGQVQYVFCDKTGTLTENNMVFKHCTIDGVDYDHNHLEAGSKGGAAGKGKENGTSEVAAVAAGRRASLEPNPKLSHVLSLTTSQVAGDFARALKVQEFFLLLAVCNTVIVAKHPHRDNMNASGFICPSSSSAGSASAASSTKITRRFRRKEAKVAALQSSPSSQEEPQPQQQAKDEVDQRLQQQSPSPPASIMSTTSSTAPLNAGGGGAPTAPTAASTTSSTTDGATRGASSSSSALSTPVASAATPQRPTRLLPFEQQPFHKPSLSPIASSPEITPTADVMQEQHQRQHASDSQSQHNVLTVAHTAPATPVSTKSKSLNLPAILNRLVSPTPNASRSATPLPTVSYCHHFTCLLKYPNFPHHLFCSPAEPSLQSHCTRLNLRTSWPWWTPPTPTTSSS